MGREEILRLIKSHDPPLVSCYIDLETQLQPAGFDLTLRKVYVPAGKGELDFSNERRTIPPWSEVPTISGTWRLEPGAYIVEYNEVVSLPLDIAALVKPRSSLLRMGATIETALWDPGYSGRGKSLLIVFNPHGVIVHVNARISQMVFFRVSGRTGTGYKGAYQGER